jgi:hypothetical protein
MSRYKLVDTQPSFYPIGFAAQLLTRTVVHTRYQQLEAVIDRPPFESRYRTDETGVPAFAPPMVLQVVLFAYTRGVIQGLARARVPGGIHLHRVVWREPPAPHHARRNWQ